MHAGSIQDVRALCTTKGKVMAGKLYLCATPIGNLEDITYRVVRTLKEVDLIAAEDTRNSIKLLNHFEIRTPMTSYHEYNKIEKAYQLVDKMQRRTQHRTDYGCGDAGDLGSGGRPRAHRAMRPGSQVTSLPGAGGLCHSTDAVGAADADGLLF